LIVAATCIMAASRHWLTPLAMLGSDSSVP
jgi:hypothetical protein